MVDLEAMRRLTEKLNISRSDVVRLAVHHLAEFYGVAVKFPQSMRERESALRTGA